MNLDYEAIDRFMKDSGLASEPAFDDLRFLTEPISQTLKGRTILGLYYPENGHDAYGYIPGKTIHLPINASYETLLHELGHRYGDFYFGNLSEEFAERWRLAHQYDVVSKTGVVMRTRSAFCQGCSEITEGRSRVCMFCEYGGMPLAAAVPDVFTVNVFFENPPGTRLDTRQFNPGQPLHISVQVRGTLGVPEPNLRVTLDIHSTSSVTFQPIYNSGNTNLAGNVAFDINLPNVVTKADCIVTVYPVIGDADIITIPIGIGTTPAPLPTPGTSVLTKALVIGAVGAVTIGLVYLAAKAAPTVAKGISQSQAQFKKA